MPADDPKDLGRGGTVSPAPSTETAKPDASTAKPAEPPKPEEPVKDQQYWSGRMAQLRTQLEQEVTLEELSRSRPMDPGPAPAPAPADPPAAADTTPYTDPISPADPSPEPPHSGPGLDLDKHVSGYETEPVATDDASTTKDPK